MSFLFPDGHTGLFDITGLADATFGGNQRRTAVDFESLAGAFKGQSFTQSFFPDNPKGFMWGRLLQAVDCPDLDKDEPEVVRLKALLGKTVKLTLGTREYEIDGETRSAVEIKAITSVNPEIRALMEAEFKARMAAMRKKRAS